MNDLHRCLARYFEGIGVKKLSAVEVDPSRSNQHEYNGVNSFANMFGDNRKELAAKILYLSDDPEESLEVISDLTWYDSRENHPTRTEYRLYYPNNEIAQISAENDLLFIGKKSDGSVLLIVAQNNSTISRQLLYLFGFDTDFSSNQFSVNTSFTEGELDIVFANILEKIDIQIEESDDQRLTLIIENLGERFPRTAEFSAYSRTFFEGNVYETDADILLMGWLNEEEKNFRILERHLVSEKVRAGFQNVDDFISFSLSVQNRRKSRAGYSLENHLRYYYSESGIQYSYNQITENNSKPDFIFPSIESYHNHDYQTSLLTMLGVKTSCKDRWRQVLAEADRIADKHLLTLEPSISTAQTNEMVSSQLQLVVPASIHSTYTSEQQNWLISFDEFNSIIKVKQSHS